MSEKTQGLGQQVDQQGCDLGELESAGGCANTHTRPKAQSVIPERSPGLMFPWPRSLSHAKYPVSLLTTRTGGDI